MTTDVARDVMGPVFTCAQFLLLAMIVYEAACLALGALVPMRSLLGQLWCRSKAAKPRVSPRPRAQSPRSRVRSIENGSNPRRLEARGSRWAAAEWFDLRHTSMEQNKEQGHDTRPR
ncbi:MAG: hypothetical protein IT432_14970 [Phycisphaerales bacterium]|nr:hypothetical protein [Phycisphaerales bacterium]